MWNVQITKWRKNVTTDKLNLNHLRARFSDGSKSSTPSLPQTTSSHLKTRLWRKQVFTPPPRETQPGEYEVIVPAFPWHAWGGGVKWLVYYILSQSSCSIARYTGGSLTIKSPSKCPPNPNPPPLPLSVIFFKYTPPGNTMSHTDVVHSFIYIRCQQTRRRRRCQYRQPSSTKNKVLSC